MRLLLRNLRVYSEGRDFHADLRFDRGRILACGAGLAPRQREKVLNLSGHLALPGLINSHDHLEFNLFPRLGSPPYANFYQWADDIYHPEATPLREILRVPPAERLRWGGYRNLISGVTTVVHHNRYHKQTFNRRFPVRVLRDYGWSHSLGHGTGLEKAFARSRGKPFIIHAGEGIDDRSAAEIPALHAMGLICDSTVLVHGIAIPAEALQTLARAGTSLVWCPESNHRLFGRTLDIERLNGRIRVSLGTDSTLSGSPLLLDEFRTASETGSASAEELLDMVTRGAASIFRLGDGRGTLRPGAPADVLVLPDNGGTAAETLLNARPRDLALVLVGGRPHLAGRAAFAILDAGQPNILVEGTPKWLTGDPAALRARIRSIVAEKILAQNPVWNLLLEMAA